MKKVAVIVAAGDGSRMNNPIPKQFLFLKNKPVLYYTIKAFTEAYEDIEIILVLGEEHIGKGQEIIDAYFNRKNFKIAPGGRTRFHSVQNGLSLLNEDDCIIFVHDGARCLVKTALIRHCYEAALDTGTAIPVIDCKDSVRIIDENVSQAIDRQKVKLVQTPQTFHSKILLPAYSIDYKDQFTDEATVVEAFGLKVNLVEGDSDNIKITTPSDLFSAEYFLEERHEIYSAE